jgi:hypothetical protein
MRLLKKSSIMHIAHVKNFSAFLTGQEVPAVIQGSGPVQEGEQVLAIRDSLAATSGLSVPQEKLHQSIGVEATVMAVDMSPNGTPQTVTVKKYETKTVEA